MKFKFTLLAFLLFLSKAFGGTPNPYMTITGETAPCPGVEYPYSVTLTSSCGSAVVSLINNSAIKSYRTTTSGTTHYYIITWKSLPSGLNQVSLTFNSSCPGNTTVYENNYSVTIKIAPDPASVNISGNSIIYTRNLGFPAGWHGSANYQATGITSNSTYAWSVSNTSAFGISGSADQPTITVVANSRYNESTHLNLTVAASGCSAISKSITIQSFPSGISLLKVNQNNNNIDSVNTNSTVLLQPNPAKNNFSIYFKGENKILNNKYSIILFSATGKKVKELSGLNNMASLKNISLLNLSNGIYFVHIFNHNKEIAVEKLVIEK